MSIIDDLQQGIDDLTDNISSYTSDNDGNISDIQSTLNDQGDTLNTLNDQAGKLTFPLDPDTADLILSLFIRGSIIFVAGSATLIDARISISSTILLSNVGNSGVVGIPSASVSTGQVVFGSTNALDTSRINYLIIA